MPLSLDVWAPIPQRVDVVVDGVEVPLTKAEEGWWRLAPEHHELLREGLDYGYRLDGAEAILPAPRSRWQPNGVHGLSRTFDPASHEWQDQDWTGRQLAGSIIYELHVGTFTPEGTLVAAIDKLDHLVELGIDLVELMPVNAFNGEHGWGYDGVGWYAVHHAYGGPGAYQEFVDACHQRGLGVIQDVVYNHLGPSGNYLPQYGPFLDHSVQSPWGSAINLAGEDSDEVRRFIIDNALMWLQDYHVDGLRLDAVHALVDTRAIHILEELAVEVNALSTFLNRPLTLIAESDLNDPRVITPREAGGYGLDAQWSDDFHHALLANLTGDDSGYYADFAELQALGKVLETGFFHDGTKSSFRGRRHGRRLDTPTIPTWRLVVCSDNHDQIGNRADGARLSTRESTRQLQIAALMTLLSPYTPMIFMGEEWAAKTPFMFFSSHPEPELAEAVSKGRVEEFSKMDWDTSTIVDPQSPEAFQRSKLDWDEVQQEVHAEVLATYRDAISLRRTYPDLTDPRFEWVSARYDENGHWFVMERGETMTVAVNFDHDPAEIELEAPSEVLMRIGEVEVVDGKLQLGSQSAAVLHLAKDALPGRA
ncbi:malto-oligosyltrehalose trehalohydrolase [Luteococcus sp. Sow4_B9]|uniref:malto-oligosyltrehalose trehalohydrolase n=1 Tax=Luteococcus sp. Sow4_B9 TaxID=3438792 RepID=UPI003F944BD7